MNLNDLHEMMQKEFETLFKPDESKAASSTSSIDGVRKSEPLVTTLLF